MKHVFNQLPQKPYATPKWEALEIKLNEMVCISGGGDAGGGINNPNDVLRPGDDLFQISEEFTLPEF